MQQFDKQLHLELLFCRGEQGNVLDTVNVESMEIHWSSVFRSHSNKVQWAVACNFNWAYSHLLFGFLEERDGLGP